MIYNEISCFSILNLLSYGFKLKGDEVSLPDNTQFEMSDLKNSNSCIILTSADITFTICYSNACTHKQGYMAILTCHTGKNRGTSSSQHICHTIPIHCIAN